MKRIRVGIVDSGYRNSVSGADRVVQAQALVLEEGGLYLTDAIEDRLGHGSSVLEVIAGQAPDVEFIVAQVFRDRLTTTPSQVAAAIDWLVEQGADLITLSLGLRNDRQPLREACENSLQQGVIMLASSPAKGDPVYPSAYPGVFRMTGDARCKATELSCLKTQYADYGGYVQAANGVVGASAGCAYMAGHIARYLSQGGDSQRDKVDQWLESQACYFGAEVRFPESQSPQE